MAKHDDVHGRDQVRDYLPQNYSALADEHGQVETKLGNAKIRDADTPLRYLFLHAGANLPLHQTVTLMAEAGMAPYPASIGCCSHQHRSNRQAWRRTLCRFARAPGELAVADRTYCSLRGVSHVVNSREPMCSCDTD